ncbi:MAG: HlyD family efflux transporter periplasmic adaptor subunit [Clostridia bacterium]|nr:HlyD family efflux transporter periplasmic adaptor subunit [Clostridia bacterium]
MEENKVKKRGWVKNAAIIFLSILLVLTFFSQTILNRSLPEVSTASVSSDTINARIRGSGTVTAGDTYEVVLGETRTVEAVYVKVGDAVAVGDKLFLLADKDSTELTQAQEQLATARRNYQSALIDMGSADYARENRNIQKLRETLADAQQKLAAGTVTPEAVNLAAANLKEAQKTQKELAKAVTDAETAYSEAQSAVSALESQIKTLEDSIEKQDRALETLEDELYRLQRGETYTQADLVKAQNALAEAKRDYANCWDQNKTALDSLRAKAESILGSSGGTSGATSAEDVIRQMQALCDGWNNDQLEGAYKATTEEYNAFQLLKPKYTALEKAQEKADSVEAGLKNNESLQTQITQKRQEISDAEETLSDTKRQLKQAKKDLAAKQDELSSADWDLTALKNRQEQQTESISAFQETYDDLKARSDSYESLKASVDSAETALEDALFALAEQKKNDSKQSAKDQLNLQAQKEEIAKLEKEVAERKENAVGAEVTAKTAGTVSTISAVAGREVAAGTALATIEVVDRGYTLKFSVTKEQAQKVRLGDKAEISNYWWGSGIDATLTQIMPDSANPSTNKLLVFTLTGEVSSGDNLNLSIGQKSANYDAVIPSSAVRSDSNGTFVLVLTAKSTPLGNRYTATRVDVKVLAQDDTKSAVSGLSYGDFVITTSSKPLDAGMQVRMVDNAT